MLPHHNEQLRARIMSYQPVVQNLQIQPGPNQGLHQTQSLLQQQLQPHYPIQFEQQVHQQQLYQEPLYQQVQHQILNQNQNQLTHQEIHELSHHPQSNDQQHNYQPTPAPPAPPPIQPQPQQLPVQMASHPQEIQQQAHLGEQIFNNPPVDAYSSIVQSLLNHSCGDHSFCKRAIESLVKKMKEKRDQLDALITAVTTSGAVPTPCVTIQRTLDGRLQVAGRKGFPHVTYAKIWRWPDLTRNELKPIRTCQYGFHIKADLICVNPYHYDRVVAAPGTNWDLGPALSPYDDLNVFDTDLSSPPVSNVISEYEWHPEQGQIINMIQSTTDDTMRQTSDQKCIPITQTPSITTTTQTTLSTTNSQTSQQECLEYNTISVPAPQPGNNNQPQTTNNSSPINNNNNNITIRYLSQIPPPEFWCTISYFELDQQVGENFRISWQQKEVTIDGYTHPSSSYRVCLGAIPNNRRPPEAETLRVHIGPGVRLLNDEDGDVWLENLSDKHAVFVNSPFLDFLHRRPIGVPVHKIHPKKIEQTEPKRWKIFDLKQIHILLSERAEAARQAAAAQAAAVAGKPMAIVDNLTNSDQLAAAAAIGVDDLRRYCVISMSFVKGWGSDPHYTRRSSIKECPCWVEITFHRALQLLDDLLRNRL